MALICNVCSEPAWREEKTRTRDLDRNNLGVALVESQPPEVRFTCLKCNKATPWRPMDKNNIDAAIEEFKVL